MLKLYALGAGLALCCLAGCQADLQTPAVLPVYRPLLMPRAALEQAVALLPARPLHRPGKKLYQGSFLLINERYEGIHIIDNQDPTQPQAVGFLRIPGSVDFAVRGPLLYADNAVDLLTIDVSNATAPRVLHRTRAVLPELPLPELATVEPGYRTDNRPPDALVVGWQKVE